VRQEVTVCKDTEIKPHTEPEIKHCKKKKCGKEKKSRGHTRQETRGQAMRVHQDQVRHQYVEPEIKPDKKEPEIKHGRGQLRRVQENQVRHVVKNEPADINPDNKEEEPEIKQAKKQQVEDIADDKEFDKPEDKGQQGMAGSSSCDQRAHVLERKPIIAEQRRVEQPQPGDKQFINGDRVKMHGVRTKPKEKQASHVRSSGHSAAEPETPGDTAVGEREISSDFVRNRSGSTKMARAGSEELQVGGKAEIHGLQPLWRGGNSKVWDDFNGAVGFITKVLAASGPPSPAARRMEIRISEGKFKGQFVGFLESINLARIEPATIHV
jgi:hypothetical protein